MLRHRRLAHFRNIAGFHEDSVQRLKNALKRSRESWASHAVVNSRGQRTLRQRVFSHGRHVPAVARREFKEICENQRLCSSLEKSCEIFREQNNPLSGIDPTGLRAVALSPAAGGNEYGPTVPISDAQAQMLTQLEGNSQFGKLVKDMVDDPNFDLVLDELPNGTTFGHGDRDGQEFPVKGFRGGGCGGATRNPRAMISYIDDGEGACRSVCAL
jgi:hypothetical protein